MNQQLTAKEIVQYFDMLPHPEGGYYKENYRSVDVINHTCLPAGFTGDRNISTAIYFLLEAGNFSAFHRIKSDECWHFYAGGAINIYVIHANGELQQIKLGSNIYNGEVFQAMVPSNCWFASEPATETSYALAGCTVAPGFDFNDFKLADAATLSQQFPIHSLLIHRLCR